MKLKELYEKLYNKIFSVKFFKAFLKIPGLEKLLQYEIISYLFFGVLTTVVNFGATALMNAAAGDGYEIKVLFSLGAFDFRWTYLVQAVAWLVSVLFAYITNKLFVFESKSFKANVLAKELGSFIGARILSFLLFEELLFAVMEKLFTGPVSAKGAFWIAKIASGIIVIIFNFVASKLVIFKNKKQGKDDQ